MLATIPAPTDHPDLLVVSCSSLRKLRRLLRNFSETLPKLLRNFSETSPRLLRDLRCTEHQISSQPVSPANRLMACTVDAGLPVDYSLPPHTSRRRRRESGAYLWKREKSSDAIGDVYFPSRNCFQPFHLKLFLLFY